MRSLLRGGLFGVVGRLEREKRKCAGDVPARLLLFDYGYPARAFAEERGQCDNRDAEMI